MLKKEERLYNIDEIQTGSFRDVAKYKLEQAKDDLESAKLLMEAGKYKAANNKAYYSCFHAVDSVLALEPVAFKNIKLLWHILIKIMLKQKNFLRK